MKKIKGIILILCYTVSLIMAILAIFSNHHPVDNFIPFILVSFLFAVVCISISIFEIVQSKRIRETEKVLWIIGIVLFFNIAELIYIIIGRRKVLGQENLKSVKSV